MTSFTHTCQLCVPTIVEVSLKRFFFFLTQGNLQGGRVKEHRMMFTWHLYLLQLYIQAVLYLITWCLLPFSPLYQNAYSPYCSLYISLCASKENLFNNQEVLQLIIISFILVTLMFDSGVILKGEIRCWSLSGIKVLLTVHIFMYMLLAFVGNSS